MRKNIALFIQIVTFLICWITLAIFLGSFGWKDDISKTVPNQDEHRYPNGRFVSNEEMAKYETFEITPNPLTDEEKRYKWPSKEVYWVKLVVNEEQINKYVENFKWLIWIMESCWVQDSISNRWKKYSDSKINELSWLDWQTVENQVKILRDTGIDFFAKAITQKCYAKAKKEKVEWNLNFIDSISNDDLIKKLEDFQHLRIELGLTTMSI